MTDPTPQTNYNKLIILGGRMDTFEAKVDGALNSQKQFAENIQDSTKNTEKNLSDF